MTDRKRSSKADQVLRLYGLHAITAVLDHRRGDLMSLYLSETAAPDRVAALVSRCRQLGIPIKNEPRRHLDRLVNGAVHQGVVADVKAPRYLGESDLDALLVAGGNALFVVLEDVQDPQNLGACLRAADGVGATAVVICGRGGVGLTPTVWKASSGAVESIRLVRVANLNKALMIMSSAGVQLIGLSGDAVTAHSDVDLRGPTALVLGSEGGGLRERTRKQCHRLVAIPMLGYCSSLNVSVATGVCLYETLRQRNSVSPIAGGQTKP